MWVRVSTVQCFTVQRVYVRDVTLSFHQRKPSICITYFNRFSFQFNYAKARPGHELIPGHWTHLIDGFIYLDGKVASLFHVCPCILICQIDSFLFDAMRTISPKANRFRYMSNWIIYHKYYLYSECMSDGCDYVVRLRSVESWAPNLLPYTHIDSTHITSLSNHMAWI